MYGERSWEYGIHTDVIFQVLRQHNFGIRICGLPPNKGTLILIAIVSRNKQNG